MKHAGCLHVEKFPGAAHISQGFPHGNATLAQKSATENNFVPCTRMQIMYCLMHLHFYTLRRSDEVCV